MICTRSLTIACLFLALSLPGQKGIGKGTIEAVPVGEVGYEGMIYHVFTPQKMKKGRFYPLVFGLHGNGNTSMSHATMMSNVSTDDAPVFVVAPGYQQEAKRNAPVIQGAGFAFEKILAKVLDKYPIDRGRVILQGFSMGSNYSTSWLNAIRNSNAGGAARAIPFCVVWLNGTAVPPRPAVLGVPFLLFVGEKETKVLNNLNIVESVRSAYATMFKGGTDVTYIEIPGMGHTINGECFRLMREHLAGLPDYSAVLLPKHADSFPELRHHVMRGQFERAITRFDEILASSDVKAKSQARTARDKVVGYLRTMLSTAARNTRPSLADFVELRRIGSILSSRPKLAASFRLAERKLKEHRLVRGELAAWIAFQKAQKLSPTKWADATDALRSLITNEGKDTEFRRRARAHVQSLGEEVSYPFAARPLIRR